LKLIKGFDGGLLKDDALIMVVNDNFNSSGVHFQAFAERTAPAHQYAAAVAQRAIKRFDNISLPFAFRARPVLVAGEYLRVGFPLVGKVPAVLTIALGQQLPKATGRGVAPIAQRPSHNAATGAFHRQPEPYFALFASDKRPHLIEFERFPALLLLLFWP